MATGIEPRQLGRLIPIWNRTIPIKPIRIATRGDLSIIKKPIISDRNKTNRNQVASGNIKPELKYVVCNTTNLKTYRITENNTKGINN